MKIDFTKMHGCGNDYIYINCFENDILNPEKLSVKLSDRRKSIGADGIILVCRSENFDAKMRIFNADGSEGKMCGNGIRCVGKFLFDNGLSSSKNMRIDTLSGVRKVDLIESDKRVSILKVDMGEVRFSAKDIPVKIESEKIVSEKIEINGKNYEINCVSVGNPHCVIFCENVLNADVQKVGKEIENSGLFPEGVNTELVEIGENNEIFMRVWERGSGETFACGTGACASVVAAVENGFFKEGKDIRVKLKGGDLVIKYKNKRVCMTGPAEEVFRGEIEI